MCVAKNPIVSLNLLTQPDTAGLPVVSVKSHTYGILLKRVASNQLACSCCSAQIPGPKRERTEVQIQQRQHQKSCPDQIHSDEIIIWKLPEQDNSWPGW